MSDGDHLLLAPRERVRELPAPLGDDREEALDARQRLVPARPRGWIVRAEQHVVEHRQEGEESPALEHVRKALARRAMSGQAVDALALEGDAPGPGREEPGDGIHQRGLARAVRAEDGDDLAFADPDRRLPQHLEIAIGDVEPLDLQHRAHRAYDWPR